MTIPRRAASNGTCVKILSLWSAEARTCTVHHALHRFFLYAAPRNCWLLLDRAFTRLYSTVPGVSICVNNVYRIMPKLTVPYLTPCSHLRETFVCPGMYQLVVGTPSTRNSWLQHFAIGHTNLSSLPCVQRRSPAVSYVQLASRQQISRWNGD